jgi:hypothetical protein
MSVPPDVIDYQPIVENAIAALAGNTPDARREVYARVRSVIAHHLQLSRQSAAIVELETLALDLAISKVERRWRMHETAAVREIDPQHEAPPSPFPAPQAGEGERAWPVVDARWPRSAAGDGSAQRQGLSFSAILPPRALRIGLAIALPVAAVLIAVFAGNNLWQRNLADRPKAQDRFLAGPEPPPAPNAPNGADAATSVGPTKVRPVRADFP